MKFTKEAIYGLTRRWEGLVNVITSEVFVSLPHDPAGGGIAPEKKPFNAIWDTGATNSAITKNVADALGLIPTGMVDVETAGGRKTVNSYVMNIHLPPQVNVIGVRVSTGDIAGADVLIGMDIIGLGDFAVTNCDGRTWMTFRVPSFERIDFVAEIDEHNRRYGKHFLPEEEKRRLSNVAKRQRKKKR